MSRSAPGVRHMNWELKARVEAGFLQANGRRMTDYDFSVMTLNEARQYAGVAGDQATFATARPAQPRMMASSRPVRAVAVDQEVIVAQLEADAQASQGFLGRILRQKRVAIPAALVLVAVFGGGVMAMSHGNTSQAASRTEKPEVTPVSNKQQNDSQNQQPVSTSTADAAQTLAGTPADDDSSSTSTPRATSPAPAPRPASPAPSPAPEPVPVPSPVPSPVPAPAIMPDSPQPVPPSEPAAGNDSNPAGDKAPDTTSDPSLPINEG